MSLCVSSCSLLAFNNEDEQLVETPQTLQVTADPVLTPDTDSTTEQTPSPSPAPPLTPENTPSLFSPRPSYEIPDGFVYVRDVIADITEDMRYFGTNNFLNAQVDGYFAPFAILTDEAALALNKASDELRDLGYTIIIYDAYRPQTAVDHFVRWAEDENDIAAKSSYYPDLDKSTLIPDGYIAKRSGHSRGSAVDLSLIDILTGNVVDMGTDFDFFGEASHHGSDMITEEQAANRLILRNAMERAGYRAYSKEWWHYILNDEPYPDTYFDFPVS